MAAELARHGYTVALPTGNAESIDILAYGRDITLAIQVKTVGRGDHQFNIGKFVNIQHEEDGRQIVLGRRKDLDQGILIVFVFLGSKAGEDQFSWAGLRDFADLLADSHADYLSRNHGRRPGKNPRSLHAALSQKVLQDRFPCQTVSELLETRAAGASS